MANYAVNDITFGPGSLASVAAAIETSLEAVDTTKTIRYLEVFQNKVTGQYEGVLIIDA